MHDNFQFSLVALPCQCNELKLDREPLLVKYIFLLFDIQEFVNHLCSFTIALNCIYIIKQGLLGNISQIRVNVTKGNRTN